MKPPPRRGGGYFRYCSKSGVQQGNVTQRKALGASTAVTNVSLVDKAMAGLAMGALWLKIFSRKRQPACKGWLVSGNLVMLHYGE